MWHLFEGGDILRYAWMVYIYFTNRMIASFISEEKIQKKCSLIMWTVNYVKKELWAQ